MKSFHVRIWGIRKRPTAKTSYEVRWKVGEEIFPATFRTKGLADAFRAKLLTASKNGEPFDTVSGLPDSMAPVVASGTWYDFACAYAALKWPFAAANSRDSISETLTGATLALLEDRPGRPTPDTLRRALRGWAFVASETRPEMPTDIANALHWVGKASRPLVVLEEPAEVRALLGALALKQSGRPAAAETVRRKRSVLYGALGHAVELGEFSEHPIDKIKSSAPRVVKQVDRRVVVNPKQARELLTALTYVGSFGRARGRRLVALFGCMYYGGLRPAEAVGLRAIDCKLPVTGWGVLSLRKTRPTAGKRWTDSGDVHDDRGLKNRPQEDAEVREVPIPPVLVTMLRFHLARFPVQDGRVFGNERGGVLGSSTYSRAWEEARRMAFTPAQVASPLAGTPYDLRHAALSSWLNAGMDPAEVARRAGNSVEVLMSRYVKCLDGRDEINNAKVDDLLRDTD
ncbi:site-specific integrase [Streptomyces sp. SID3343]|uniref:site-specific integrase n=1 Tax=Streptomyces sp. SID3343 TaxID=2690260 RepID=UPI001369B489|nr:site-specific integrase [Streptomyces sp. SID3343]